MLPQALDALIQQSCLCLQQTHAVVLPHLLMIPGKIGHTFEAQLRVPVAHRGL